MLMIVAWRMSTGVPNMLLSGCIDETLSVNGDSLVLQLTYSVH